MTEPNKCACGHAAFGHDDGRGECFTSGCKCRTLTEPTDLDALIAEARGFAAGSESARSSLMRDLADALTAVSADLARAREVIEKVRNLPQYEVNALSTAVDAYDLEDILASYDPGNP